MRLMHEQSLNRCAHLACLAERGLRNRCSHAIQLCVLTHDRGADRSEFHLRAPQADSRLQPDPDLAATRERVETEPMIRGQCGANYPAAAEHDVQPARRHARVLEALAQLVGGDRGNARRLQHDRVACRERWGDLVGDRVQRRVERGDRAHRPDRQPQREREPVRLAARAIDRHDVSGDACRLLGTQLERVDRPGDVDVGLAFGETGLGHEQLPHLGLPTRDDGRGSAENLRPAIRLDPLLAMNFPGRGGRGVDVRLRGQTDRTNGGARVLVLDDRFRIGLDPPAVDQ